jgi:hypothetical protein
MEWGLAKALGWQGVLECLPVPVRIAALPREEIRYDNGELTCIIGGLVLYPEAWREMQLIWRLLECKLSDRLNVLAVLKVSFSQLHKHLIYHVRFQVSTAATMKNAVFWFVTLCGSCKKRRSSETLVLTGAKWRNIAEDSILRLILRISPGTLVAF